MDSNNRKRNRADEERTLKDLTPNVAALLCYVGGWISGLILLVLEQKNRFVRFHAIQSIIVFGFLTVAGGILGKLPGIGPFFSGVIGLTGFILWIILIIKALQGDLFQLPWAGDWAARIVYESGPDSPEDSAGTTEKTSSASAAPLTPPQASSSQAAPPPSPVAPPAPVTNTQPEFAGFVPPQAEKAEPVDSTYSARNQPSPTPVYSQPTRSERFRTRYYSHGAHNARIAGSAFAIAWSLAWLIFLNFFNQYIAYFEHVSANQWVIHTLVTSDFSRCQPILDAALIVSIIGHALLIGYDKYWARSVFHIIRDILSLATVVTLLVIFPFDFSSIPGVDSAHWIEFGLTAFFILTAIGCGIGAFARFINLIIHIAERRY